LEPNSAGWRLSGPNLPTPAIEWKSVENGQGTRPWIISTFGRFMIFPSGSATCFTFGQHVNSFQSESPRGNKVRELVVAAHSQYPHLVTSTVCITNLPEVVNQAADALSRNWIDQGEGGST